MNQDTISLNAIHLPHPTCFQTLTRRRSLPQNNSTADPDSSACRVTADSDHMWPLQDTVNVTLSQKSINDRGTKWEQRGVPARRYGLSTASKGRIPASLVRFTEEETDAHHMLLQGQDLRLLVLWQTSNLLRCELHHLLQQRCRHETSFRLSGSNHASLPTLIQVCFLHKCHVFSA